MPESRGRSFSKPEFIDLNVKSWVVFAFSGNRKRTNHSIIIPSSEDSPTSFSQVSIWYHHHIAFFFHRLLSMSCPHLKMQWKFRGSGIICSSTSAVYKRFTHRALFLLLGPGRIPTISPNQKHVTKATRPKPKRIPGAPKKSSTRNQEMMLKGLPTVQCTVYLLLIQLDTCCTMLGCTSTEFSSSESTLSLFSEVIRAPN